MALAVDAEKAHLDPRGSAKQQQTRGSPLFPHSDKASKAAGARNAQGQALTGD